ncbi:MAG: sialidase family protein, partial [Acidobacteriota bacterium]
MLNSKSACRFARRKLSGYLQASFLLDKMAVFRYLLTVDRYTMNPITLGATLMIQALSAFLLLFSVVVAPPAAQDQPFFEQGVATAPADGAYHAYPVIARTAAGNLFLAWSMVNPKTQDGRIVGAFSSDGGRTWGGPKTLIDRPGQNDADPCIVVDGPVILVYSTTVDIPNKIDRSETWMVKTEDEGKTWTQPIEIKLRYKYVVGKRHLGVRLQDGTLVMPFSWDLWAEAGMPARTEGEMDLKSGVLLSKDHGATWAPHGELHIFEPKVRPSSTWGLDEPALVELWSGELLMLFRTGTSWLWEARSPDGGKTWSEPRRTSLLGHNTPMALWRNDQNPQEIILIWNNSALYRHPLSVALSDDGGHTWSRPKNVATAPDGSLGPAPGFQVSYPGITQDRDGAFVAVWQHQLPGQARVIRWARFNRAWALEQ